MWDTADPLAPLAWMDDQRRDRLGAVGDRPRRRGEWLRRTGRAPSAAARPVRRAARARPIPARGSATAASWSSPARPGCAPAPTTRRRAASSPPTRCRRCSGTAYSANTYHYAGNDPLGKCRPARPAPGDRPGAARDPRPDGLELLSRNKDWIIAGALIVGGIAVMATGVGGPLGAAMIGGALLSAGSSAAIQKVTTGRSTTPRSRSRAWSAARPAALGYGAGALVSGALEGERPSARGAARGRRRELRRRRGQPRHPRPQPVRPRRHGAPTCSSAAASAASAGASARAGRRTSRRRTWRASWPASGRPRGSRPGATAPRSSTRMPPATCSTS